VVGPCYETLDDALSHAPAVVRSWTAGAPENFRLLLSIGEEEPFHIVLAAYEAPERPEGAPVAWLSALVLRREHCGWMWAGAATRQRRTVDPGMAFDFETVFDRDRRFWLALGETSAGAGAVDCVYADGVTTTVAPVESAVVVGGRLRGPRRLEVRDRAGVTIEEHRLPRAFAIELPPRNGPAHGEFDIETWDDGTVSADDEGSRNDD
jgi:hypothetical protein